MIDYWEPQIRESRTVRVYADKSELIYLPGEDRYIWQRPLPNGKGVEETPVAASSDEAAMQEAGRIAYTEWWQQKAEKDSPCVI